MSKLTYKDAGVDIEAGDALVQKIKAKVKRTCGPRVISGVGGFACLYDLDGERYLAAGTDGVGTKLIVAQKLGIHNTIGIDLVAMCCNDILCTGAKGLFFMDYLATGKLDLAVSEQIIEGIVEGCLQAKMALIGGETAEMPGMYAPGKYDLAGFGVGEVMKDDVIDGSKIQNGDSIIGLASSGIHSNGLSLARLLGREFGDDEYWHALLTPTRIYTPYVEKLWAEKIPVHGLAHITGGGLDNIGRINAAAHVVVDSFPGLDEVAPIFKVLTERSGLADDELRRTFNMGVGMVVVSPEPALVLAAMAEMGLDAWVIGSVEI